MVCARQLLLRRLSCTHSLASEAALHGQGLEALDLKGQSEDFVFRNGTNLSILVRSPVGSVDQPTESSLSFDRSFSPRRISRGRELLFKVEGIGYIGFLESLITFHGFLGVASFRILIPPKQFKASIRVQAETRNATPLRIQAPNMGIRTFVSFAIFC